MTRMGPPIRAARTERVHQGFALVANTNAIVAIAIAACLCCPQLSHAGEPTVPEGLWAGGFWIGERCIPYILHTTAHMGAPPGDATLDRIDRIGPPEPASSVTMEGDSLRIGFTSTGGDRWSFVLKPESASLIGSLVVRNKSGESRLPARFVSTAHVNAATLAAHAGLYESESDARVRISVDEDGTLIAHFKQDDRFQMLFPADPARFFAGDGPTRAAPAVVSVEFSNGTLVWTEVGDSQTFSRVAESTVPLTLSDDVVVRGDLTLPLTRIPAGSFSMGQHVSNAETIARLGLTPPKDVTLPDPEPRRRTTLTQSFFMSRFEVTNAWFAAFVAETGYMTDAERAGYGLLWNGEGFDRTPGISWHQPGVDAPPDAPVVFVSWNDASEFTAWLTRRLGRAVRLPTEAEWEYACAAGTVAMFSCGNDTLRLDEHAWSSRNATAARPVGTKLPNPWGLYDMHGNVWEWCTDGYAAMDDAPAVDPTGASDSRTKVLRGGSWINGPWSLRSAYRGHERATLAEPHIGFRCVMETGN